MDEKIAQQILDELLPYLEALETRTAAVLQFLKEAGIASEEKLGPYFEQAGKASDVKWRAARIRLGSLVASAAKAADNKPEEKSPTEDQEDLHKPATADAQADDAQDAAQPPNHKAGTHDRGPQNNRHQPKDTGTAPDESARKTA